LDGLAGLSSILENLIGRYSIGFAYVCTDEIAMSFEEVTGSVVSHVPSIIGGGV
jgi:hypothetical protein